MHSLIYAQWKKGRGGVVIGAAGGWGKGVLGGCGEGLRVTTVSLPLRSAVGPWGDACLSVRGGREGGREIGDAPDMGDAPHVLRLS